MTVKLKDVKPGDGPTKTGWYYLSEASEQPDGSWSVMMRAPSGRRTIIDFDSGDADSDMESWIVGVTETCKRLASFTTHEAASGYISTLPDHEKGIYYIDRM